MALAPRLGLSVVCLVADEDALARLLHSRGLLYEVLASADTQEGLDGR